MSGETKATPEEDLLTVLRRRRAERQAMRDALIAAREALDECEIVIASRIAMGGSLADRATLAKVRSTLDVITDLLGEVDS